ncbi:MAG TPA: hypothetical protein VFH63_11030 [candidate division Zixibacteria bacterium]|nr:hypothetical protein [candidate division Zixibacteria bacterium]
MLDETMARLRLAFGEQALVHEVLEQCLDPPRALVLARKWSEILRQGALFAEPHEDEMRKHSGFALVVGNEGIKTRRHCPDGIFDR